MSNYDKWLRELFKPRPTEEEIQERRRAQEIRDQRLADQWSSDPNFFFKNQNQHLPTKALEAYKVVALSVGINPEHESLTCWEGSDPIWLADFFLRVAPFCEGKAKTSLTEFSRRFKQIRGNLNERTIPVVEQGRFELFNTIRICDFLDWAEENTDWHISAEFPRAQAKKPPHKGRKKPETTILKESLIEIWKAWPKTKPKPDSETLLAEAKRKGIIEDYDNSSETIYLNSGREIVLKTVQNWLSSDPGFR